ncbi:AHH domain-containing protein [Vibrio coralliilyticus]|uniref:AHH domain-containing protein n=1 Tax=Vibrio coralliilyticus TaxID=190893 RepID=UPI00240A8BE2|nr:AHH domain-containing protein [Vibrio coralliilyticus]WFB47230.1 AHH domain-containing protein [Vibrio coralliilyticus]
MTSTNENNKCSVKEFEGDVVRQSDSYKLASAELRSSHPLNLKSGTLDAHHIISDMVVGSLASFRTLQMQRKGWSMNHGSNLVLLSSDEEICCYYETPQHSSGHTDPNIEGSFYSSKAKMSAESAKVKDKSLKKSIDSTTGYHKVVAIKLALTLKNLDCDTDFKIYVKEIDKVSNKILKYISKFKLLLKSDGVRFKENNTGCGMCVSRDSHYSSKEFVFYNRKLDKEETQDYKEKNNGSIVENTTYEKNDKEYFASSNKNSVYENIYKEVKNKSEVKFIIFDSKKGRLRNVKELGK